jgi:dTDP-4-amino-4,6-dideoxygalactose transaminase
LAIARQRIHLPPRAWSAALGGWVRGDLWNGEALARFEAAFASSVGAAAAVAVPAGRAGLRFIFETLGLAPGAEVLCSAFAYPVVPHVARTCGYDVRFVDCELQTLGMDPRALAAAISSRTRVVIATHLYGVPCRIREIAELASSCGATLIEDCAHCFGVTVGARQAGTFGSFAYFSFETSKILTTMGGGMVVTSDPEAASRLRAIARREHDKRLGWLVRRLLQTSFEATVTHPWIFDLAVWPALRLAERRDDDGERFASGYQRDEITMAGRMGRYTNYQAQLGLRQLERAPRLIERRVANARRLIGRLEHAVRFQAGADPDARPNYMLVTALFPQMRQVARRLLELGVDTKRYYMRDCSHLLDGQPSFPRAARAEREVLHLPAYPELDPGQIDRVAERVERAVAELGGASAAPVPEGDPLQAPRVPRDRDAAGGGPPPN